MAKESILPQKCAGCDDWVTTRLEYWAVPTRDGDVRACPYCPHCIAAIKDSYRLRQYQGHA